MERKEMFRRIFNAMRDSQYLMPVTSDKLCIIANDITNDIIGDVRFYAAPAPASKPEPRRAIAASSHADHYGRTVTTAVANDGTIWTKDHSGLWHELPKLPESQWAYASPAWVEEEEG